MSAPQMNRAGYAALTLECWKSRTPSGREGSKSRKRWRVTFRFEFRAHAPASLSSLLSSANVCYSKLPSKSGRALYHGTSPSPRYCSSGTTMDERKAGSGRVPQVCPCPRSEGARNERGSYFEDPRDAKVGPHVRGLYAALAHAEETWQVFSGSP